MRWRAAIVGLCVFVWIVGMHSQLPAVGFGHIYPTSHLRNPFYLKNVAVADRDCKENFNFFDRRRRVQRVIEFNSQFRIRTWSNNDARLFYISSYFMSANIVTPLDTSRCFYALKVGGAVPFVRQLDFQRMAIREPNRFLKVYCPYGKISPCLRSSDIPSHIDSLPCGVGVPPRLIPSALKPIQSQQTYERGGDPERSHNPLSERVFGEDVSTKRVNPVVFGLFFAGLVAGLLGFGLLGALIVIWVAKFWDSPSEK